MNESETTKDDYCPFWGPLDGFLYHPDCDVFLRNAHEAAHPPTEPLPIKCKCECRTCKRAWWAAGRP